MNNNNIPRIITFKELHNESFPPNQIQWILLTSFYSLISKPINIFKRLPKMAEIIELVSDWAMYAAALL